MKQFIVRKREKIEKITDLFFFKKEPVLLIKKNWSSLSFIPPLNKNLEMKKYISIT